MSLSDLVSVTISKQTASVSRAGFGTPMIMSTEADEDVRFADTAKIYTSLDGMGSTGDGFDTAGVTYKMAQTLFSQNPKVSQIVVGKRASPPLMTVNMIPIVVANTDYVVTIGGRGVTGADSESFTFDSGAAPTVASIIAGVVAAINLGAQKVLATDNTTDMDIEAAATAGGVATAGKPYTLVFNRALWTAQNVTPDPGLVADLSTIRTAIDGNDDWYAAYVDSFGIAEITVMAAAIEALLKIYLPTTFDSDVLTSAVDDIGSVLQAANYARTAISWHETAGSTDLAAAWGGANLPTDPGSITWKFTDVAGPAFSILTPAEQAFVTAKGVNDYVRIAGNNMMQEGVMAGGEFIDITRGIDFITARLMENVFGQMKSLPKIPFTDPGIAVIENQVIGVMSLGISNGIFAASPAPVVTVPAAADVDSTDKANRLLPNVTFTATLAGAIHATEISGIVTV